MSTGILEVVRRLSGATAKTTALVATTAVEKVIQAFERDLNMDVQDCDVKITAVKKEIAGLEIEYRSSAYDCEISDVRDIAAENRMEKLAAELRQANVRLRNLKSARERALELKLAKEAELKDKQKAEKRKLIQDKYKEFYALGQRVTSLKNELSSTLEQMMKLKSELWALGSTEFRQTLADIWFSLPVIFNHQLKAYGFKATLSTDIDDWVTRFPKIEEFSDPKGRFYL